MWRARTERTTVFLQTTKWKKNEATVRRCILEEIRRITVVRWLEFVVIGGDGSQPTSTDRLEPLIRQLLYPSQPCRSETTILTSSPSINISQLVCFRFWVPFDKFSNEDAKANANVAWFPDIPTVTEQRFYGSAPSPIPSWLMDLSALRLDGARLTLSPTSDVDNVSNNVPATLTPVNSSRLHRLTGNCRRRFTLATTRTLRSKLNFHRPPPSIGLHFPPQPHLLLLLVLAASLRRTVLLDVDASVDALSAVLSHPNDKGLPAVIAHASRSLSQPEPKYSATRQQILAIPEDWDDHLDRVLLDCLPSVHHTTSATPCRIMFRKELRCTTKWKKNEATVRRCILEEIRRIKVVRWLEFVVVGGDGSVGINP
ncbi:hypothetical protein T02_7831 [Trichinella nativa]|uniref:Reverse transcriptase/retrotransposon-derived protein RNase H-like domain-containing protein n=1 Tax=Trichinella nativa TaxID=6335 RepID=A0A0V1LQ72_9BILA|nr:hypothetical protein T02_7831 [Trichinella nativa]